MDEHTEQIIDAINGGNHTLRSLMSYTGIRSSVMSARLQSLCKYGILKRSKIRSPYSDGKASIFWYEVVE